MQSLNCKYVMSNFQYDVLVIGSGPAGYACAFRASDLGLKVGLIEKHQQLGGVCLNVGCIPSKALLNIAKHINHIIDAKSFGINAEIQLNIDTMIKHQKETVKKLNLGLGGMAKRRKVDVFTGNASFIDDHHIKVKDTKEKEIKISFENVVIATGSKAIELPFLPKDNRIFTSTKALDLPIREGHLVIIGGGIIGCEMATIYNAIGVDVTIIEATENIMLGADSDIIKPCKKLMSQRGIQFLTHCKVSNVESHNKHLSITYTNEKTQQTETIKAQGLLQSVGRKPQTAGLECENAGIKINEQGFIITDPKTLKTSQEHIFAIGDVTQNPMLAHKATAQGRVCAEIIKGKKVIFDAKVIPNVAYTDPEVAWVGLNEMEAKKNNIDIKKASFPWKASGRALCIGRSEGLTKLLACSKTGNILGAGIVGENAGELIDQITLAIEMGANCEDLSLMVHPHPTLTETIGLAAEMIEGTITDL